METSNIKIPIVDIFPYKIQNRENFLFRDHPEGLDPESSMYKEYWIEQLRGYIEGKWIYDGDTWVWFPPKLNFYANYAKIEDKFRDIRHPDLRDVEWIIFSYLTGMDGFSGFELDEKYTSHFTVGRIEAGEELDEVQLSLIPDSARFPDGSGFKKYIHPWEYLTRQYLIEDKAAAPLGRALFENDRLNGLLMTARGLGKDNRWDTIVYTEEGKKYIKDVNVGDRIYGADGKLTTIIDKVDYYNQMQYKVTFDDGRYTYCGDGHLWEVYKVGGSKDRSYVLPLKEIRKNYLGHKRKEGERKSIVGKRDTRYFIKLCEPLQYTEKDLPIDPYFLGIWLGDGTSSGSSITTEDEEIKNLVYQTAEKYNLKIRVCTSSSKTCPTYFLTTGIEKAGKGNYILEKLNELDLTNNKHIPEIYLRASEEQRMELLRGLMDSDGYISKSGHIEFVQKNKKLIDDFCDLVGGLGIKYSVKEKVLKFLYGKQLSEPKLYYRVKMNTGKKIFNLPRKVERLICDVVSPQVKTNRGRVGIRSIEPVGVDHSVCIGLDNDDKLFVCDSHIVTHNSVSCFVGDIGHEFLIGGIRRFEDIGKINTRLNFFAGCQDAGQLNRSISAFRQFYYNQPGQFLRNSLDESEDDEKYWGAFFKNVQGQWEAKGGSKLQHLVKDRSGKPDILGSILEFRPIGEGSYGVSAGDRFRRIYAEEAGLMDILEFYRYNKDSTEIGNDKVGSFLGLGTSGNMVKVQAAAKMLFNPDPYKIMSIPNYWVNPEKRIGLFIPTPYKYGEYKDENGNTRIELAYERFFKNREKAAQEMDGPSYDSEVMHNPGTPDELLRPSDDSLMPKALARNQQSFIEAHDIFEKFAIGDFEWNPTSKRGVEFVKDMSFTRRPIIDYHVDRSKIDNRGAPVVYEFPDQEHVPDNLYWVIYDPAAKEGQSGSFHSLLVYKYFYSGDETSMYDTIVCDWIGRYDKLEDNYNLVVKIAKFYNAKIFPEMNTPGFVDWCRREGYSDMLEPDAYFLEQEIHGHKAIKRSYYQVGFQMNERKKFWCDQKIAGWLKDVKQRDPVSNAPILQTINWIYSLRLLDEIIHYNTRDNFDHISSLRGLMLLLGKLETEPVLLREEEEKEDYSRFITLPEDYSNSERPSFLKY